ncbi:MAG: tetratricopeptide repeat protein [Armatimonadota bacterium]
MAAESDTLQQAHECRINGQYDEAIELYQQVLEEDPEHAEALWGVGLSLMNSGDFDEALAKICQAAEIEPDNQLYLLDAGKHYTMLGMYDEAKPFFEKVLVIDAASKYGSEAQKQLSYYE